MCCFDIHHLNWQLRMGLLVDLWHNTGTLPLFSYLLPPLSCSIIASVHNTKTRLHICHLSLRFFSLLYCNTSQYSLNAVVLREGYLVWLFVLAFGLLDAPKSFSLLIDRFYLSTFLLSKQKTKQNIKNLCIMQVFSLSIVFQFILSHM